MKINAIRLFYFSFLSGICSISVSKANQFELHKAIKSQRSLGVIKQIAQENIHVINVHDNKGDTPLFLALFHPNAVKLLTLLIRLGADVNVSTERKVRKWFRLLTTKAPLLIEFFKVCDTIPWKMRKEIFQLLLQEGADVNQPLCTIRGARIVLRVEPLKVALDKEDLFYAQELIKHGADYKKLKNLSLNQKEHLSEILQSM